ncbi:UNVERIFIED_CONTAM: hypothetical protein GTU68_017069 [Idotea baltica]|nr:hypothetical protein [Idotea baltica]
MTLIVTAHASTPAEDAEALRAYYKKTLGDKIKIADFINGTYALNEDARMQWEEIEEFPPYEIGIEKGEELWSKKFKNGKSFASCFGEDISGLRAKYPYHDEAQDTIITLEGDINKCLTDNGEKPYKWKKGNIAYVSAYVAFQGRGGKIDVQPKTEKALAWYNKGKNFFYTKRGQLNMACADCHVYYANKMVRAEPLSPAIGHTSHFPVLRSKWGELGTLHRRYGGCNANIRAKAFKAQSDEYKALEYFEAVMSNGLVLNGPGARK